MRSLCVFSQSNKIGTVVLKRSVFKVCLCCAELSASLLSNTNCYVLISHGDDVNLYIDVLGKQFPLNSDSRIPSKVRRWPIRAKISRPGARRL